MENKIAQHERDAMEKSLEEYGFRCFREVGPLYSPEPDPPTTRPRRRREVAARTPAPKRRSATSMDDPNLQRVVQRKAMRPAKDCAGRRKLEDPKPAARSNKPRIISIERVALPIIHRTKTPGRPAPPASATTTSAERTTPPTTENTT